MATYLDELLLVGLLASLHCCVHWLGLACKIIGGESGRTRARDLLNCMPSWTNSLGASRISDTWSAILRCGRI